MVATTLSLSTPKKRLSPVAKKLQKMYYRHSGFPGGIRDARLEEVREKFPERIIEFAVKGMLPKNKLSPERMKRLKVYVGSEHQHAAQKPETISLKGEVK
jgi:large subunit ribosomal protein L13